jgi:hypothetical protein
MPGILTHTAWVTLNDCFNLIYVQLTTPAAEVLTFAALFFVVPGLNP